MCGIIAILLANTDHDAFPLLVDGLTMLQHRGQDAAGIMTCKSNILHMRKNTGLVHDVFGASMPPLVGHMGLGHVRYPTAGTSSCAEAQPLYTNCPYGICLSHNGNLVNTDVLKRFIHSRGYRHLNTDSDSEILLNIFAIELARLCTPTEFELSMANPTAVASNAISANINSSSNDDNDASSSNNNNDKSPHSSPSRSPPYSPSSPPPPFTLLPDHIFDAVAHVMRECSGGYAVSLMIVGVGLVAFRDPYGIRPLVFGYREGLGHVIASETVAVDSLGFELTRDLNPGEAIFIDMKGNMHSKQCHASPMLAPCLFEFVYFARPDSVMDGVSVYQSRLKMGEFLANRIAERWNGVQIDVVVPVPDTSRPAAQELASRLNVPHREALIKNRYIARTFIMPGQAIRKKGLRLKLNVIRHEIEGKNVLLVDDSIVRGNTAEQIVSLVRSAGAKKVYFASAAPQVKYQNVYGIDMPTCSELVSADRTTEQVCKTIGADKLIFLDLDDLKASVCLCATPNGPLRDTTNFEGSCFDGVYVTGDVSPAYLQGLQEQRNEKRFTTSSSATATNGVKGDAHVDKKRKTQSVVEMHNRVPTMRNE
eukprot:c4803_g1_i1.p1 GENE.c4803_g1_i1~~c4803_g1_i1.p1  ORF type:complete len:594 (-),score=180.42 c4803_g1_i1:130-1911(-)